MSRHFRAKRWAWSRQGPLALRTGLSRYRRLLDNVNDLSCAWLYEIGAAAYHHIAILDVGNFDCVKLNRVRQRRSDIAFTRALSGNLIGKGIRVNAVAPGPVWTPLNPSEKEAEDISTFSVETPMKGRMVLTRLVDLY
jgi:Enoyl-(Acyl carrier protein) reductase